jgi:hypothetical protein
MRTNLEHMFMELKLIPTLLRLSQNEAGIFLLF